MKDFYKDGNRIILGDAIEALTAVVPDNTADLIFADPPYNIGKDFRGTKDRWNTEEEYIGWCFRWIDLCIRKLKPRGSFYLMAATQQMPLLDLYVRKHLTVLSRIVWFYDSSGVQAKTYFGSLYEPILFCVKNEKDYTFNAEDILVEAKTGAVRKLIDYRKPIPAAYNTTKIPGNVWQIPRVRYRMDEYENHPTQKPIALLDRIIRASSNKGDTVLDPFSGTFTTSYVAQQLERKSIGIDIEEEYVKIGLRRLEVASHYNGQEIIKEPRSFERSTRRLTQSLFDK
jgi:site-specific DNA-methyltransferase (adenine-specific)